MKIAYTEPGLWYPLLPDESRLHLLVSLTGRSGKGNDFRLSLLLRETKLWTEPWQLRKPTWNTQKANCVNMRNWNHNLKKKNPFKFLCDRESMKHSGHDDSVMWSGVTVITPKYFIPLIPQLFTNNYFFFIKEQYTVPFIHL